MVNIADSIYNHYTKKLNLFELAYGAKAKWIKTIIFIVAALFGTYYFYNFKPIKAFFLFILSLCFAAFIEYSRYKVIKSYNKFIGDYSLSEAGNDVHKIIISLLLEYIDGKGLLNKCGIDYLVKIYINKSEKHKIKDIALGVIVLTVIIEKLTDLIFGADQKGTEKINDVYMFIKSSLPEAIAIAVTILIGILLIRYCIFAAIAYFLNRKSDNFKKLSEFLEEMVMPLIIRCEIAKINSEDLKTEVLRLICKDSHIMKETSKKQKSRIKVHKKL